MAILGNLFLAIATLITFIIISTVYGSKPATSGDAAVGYPMGAILFHLAFFACMAVASVAIAWKGGFEWMSNRYGMVALGLILIVLTAALSALFKYEPRPPFSVRYLSGFVPALFPLVLILSAAIMLNEGLRTAVPVAVYKIPLAIVFWISVLSTIGSVFAWVWNEKESAEIRINSMQDDEKRYERERMAQVDSCDAMRSFTNILVFTTKNHSPELREKAVAKVKSNPAWQQELVKLLEGDGCIEAFYFLSANAVDDKQLFAEPVHKGVLSLAKWVRSSIDEYSHPSHFYSDQFLYEVDKMLPTVDTFKGLGVDYLPAVREVRAALDEPNKYNQKNFTCKARLDRWIRENEKGN